MTNAFKLNNYANTDFTSLKGSVELSYSRMVELFGEPVEGDYHKVSGEWVFEGPNGDVYTIYDWKSTDLYDYDLPSVGKFRSLPKAEFNIGGRSNAAEFIEWLENKLK